MEKKKKIKSLRVEGFEGFRAKNSKKSSLEKEREAGSGGAAAE